MDCVLLLFSVLLDDGSCEACYALDVCLPGGIGNREDARRMHQRMGMSVRPCQLNGTPCDAMWGVPKMRGPF